MKKSTRALVGMVVLDLLLLCGIVWLVMQVQDPATNTTVPKAEAISTITSIGGGVIGIVSVILLLAFFYHRRRGN